MNYVHSKNGKFAGPVNIGKSFVDKKHWQPREKERIGFRYVFLGTEYEAAG